MTASPAVSLVSPAPCRAAGSMSAPTLVFPGSGRDMAGRARGPQPKESLMPLTLVPAAAPAPAKTAPAGPRSWVERYEDEHGEFYVAHCTCTWASPERADPGEAETARALHDDTHLPPGHPDHSLFRLDTVAADDPEAFDDLDEGGEP